MPRPHQIAHRRHWSTAAGLLAGERLERRDCPAPVLSIALNEPIVLEGESVVCTLRLSEPSKVVEHVFVTAADGTATYGTDYFAPVSQQVVFAPGQMVRTVSISTLRDAGGPLAEGNETFRVTATPTTTSLGTRTAIATIADYVPPPVISVQDIAVVEGNSGAKSATFTLGLSSRYPRAVTVTYATRDLTATAAGQDYVAATGTLTFAAGETSKTLSVTVNGDQFLETDERFEVVLSGAKNATLGRSSAIGTISNDEQDTAGYQITLSYNNPALPAAQKAVFERAATRLQQIVVGDVPGVTLANGQFIDDIRMQVYVEAMDPDLNGYAQALQWRAGAGGLPYDGEIHINASRIGNPGIYHTIIHECLHAMGFSPNFFQRINSVSGLGTTQPLFTGANAIREYGSAFGIALPTGVPLYGDLSAQGSYGSHWDTATFGTEIMSVGWDTTSTGLRPFSRITVGALQDLGYQVNYATADQYTRPADSVRIPVTSGALPTAPRTPRTGVDVTPSRGTVAPAPRAPTTAPIRPAIVAPQRISASAPASVGPTPLPSESMARAGIPDVTVPSKTPRVFVRV